MKEGRKPEYPEKTPGDELQKMPHTTARRFKHQARLEPAQQHWWQSRKADMLTVTPRVAPPGHRHLGRNENDIFAYIIVARDISSHRLYTTET